MKTYILLLGQALLWAGSLIAQTASSFGPPQQIELGKWWKNSAIVSQLTLSEGQVIQIEQAFLEHRSKLANLNAELKREDAELKQLMRRDPLDEGAVRAQTQKVASARTALETANSSMMLSIRKVLSRDQWTKLEEIRNSNVYTAGANGVVAPRVIRHPAPAYTDPARDAKIEGNVLLDVIIRKDGTVDSFKVIKGLGYGLDESAINTIAKEWRFEPGTKDGKPVDVRAKIEVSFRRY